jgi:hypothetical protein
MFTLRNFKALALLVAPFLFFQPSARAQSGRTPPRPARLPSIQPAPAPAPVDDTRYDKVKVIVARGIQDFVKALNEQGRLGYRLEKTVGYGDTYDDRKYAAVLHLDPGHRYDYVSDPMPEDAKYGDPLNYHARRGYSLAHAYALTQCRRAEVYDNPLDPSTSNRTQETYADKSNVLLFMRRDGVKTQAKEYRVFKGLFAPDGGQKKELQAALDAAPPGFRPVRLLFSTTGGHTFYVTVVTERDLNEAAPPKVEYQLVKEVFGFEDEVNRLAAAGARYVGGGRSDDVKIALLERRAGGASAYAFVEDDRKEFERQSAAGDSYAGLLAGDLTCGSERRLFLQKLVFARDASGGRARVYKVLQIADPKLAGKTGPLPAPAVAELQHHLAEGFRVRDIFYAYGLYVILEK